MPQFIPARIVSGGQTGVDRAALDVAIALSIPHGGWCPLGRRAEDGVIDSRYHLRETDERGYAVRTQRNVLDSDATLILAIGTPATGTLLTFRLAGRHDRSHLLADPSDANAAEQIQSWLSATEPSTLNIAGPRESSSPGIGRLAEQVLREVLT